MTDRNQLLRGARNRRGLTGHDVAALTGIPESRVYKLESSQNVSEGTLRKYYDAKLINRDEFMACFLGDVA